MWVPIGLQVWTVHSLDTKTTRPGDQTNQYVFGLGRCADGRRTGRLGRECTVIKALTQKYLNLRFERLAWAESN